MNHQLERVLTAGGRPVWIVGVARFIRPRDSDSMADLAVTVADHWQGRGLGPVLLDLLGGRARTVGVRRFEFEVLAGNDAVRALVRSAGGRCFDPEDGTVLHGHIGLSP